MKFTFRFGVLVAAAAFVLLPARAHASTITYADFSSTVGLTMNPVATTAGNVLRLTGAGTSSASGSAWFNTLQNVSAGFDTTFQFRITPGIGFNGEPSADGIVFMIQNSVTGTGAIGAAGDGIGYGGIDNSVAIEFDTFCNGTAPGCYPSTINDPNGNHVSVIAAPIAGNPTIQLQSNSLGTGIPGFAMDDSQVHTAHIVYDAGAQTLKVFLDNALVVQVLSFNLAAHINLNGGDAYMGFTSGTGAATANHDILSWSSRTGQAAVPEPAALLLLGVGLIGVVRGWVRARR